MTQQSAAVNDKLKTDMHNNFTVGTNIYPASMQKSLHLLDKYSKQIAVQPVQPQGNSFAQGGRGSGRGRGGVVGDPGHRCRLRRQDPRLTAARSCNTGGQAHGRATVHRGTMWL